MRSQMHWQPVHPMARTSRQHPTSGPTWTKGVKALWQRAIAHLTVSDEPHVWHSQDAQGQTLWNAYDSRTGRSISRVSATNLRIWLEERHYQSF